MEVELSAMDAAGTVVTVTMQESLIVVPSTVAVTVAVPAASAMMEPLFTDTIPRARPSHTVR